MNLIVLCEYCHGAASDCPACQGTGMREAPLVDETLTPALPAQPDEQESEWLKTSRIFATANAQAQPHCGAPLTESERSELAYLRRENLAIAQNLLAAYASLARRNAACLMLFAAFALAAISAAEFWYCVYRMTRGF